MAKSKSSKKTKAKGNLFVRIGRAIKAKPKISLLIAVVLIVTSVGVVPKIKQSFAAGCSGTKIDTYTLKRPSDGAYAGYINLYYYKGNNCAIAYAGGVTANKSMNRYVCIDVVGDGLSKRCDGPGWWLSYAGPVWSYPSDGRCIDVSAKFSTNSSTQGYVFKNNVHCG